MFVVQTLITIQFHLHANSEMFNIRGKGTHESKNFGSSPNIDIGTCSSKPGVGEIYFLFIS